MRLFLVCSVWLLSALGFSQVPDVRIRMDAILDTSTRENGQAVTRLYDALGRHGVVELELFLEQGFRGFISQRLQRIHNDADDDSFDEYYIEDPGIWRAGKQVLPFGSGRLLRESVMAVRGDTSLVLENFPVTLAICDAGDSRQRGVVGRIGRGFSVSFAIGEHFGISGSSLTWVRSPEESPGIGRGFRQIFGADLAQRFGTAFVRLEGAVMGRGHTAADKPETIVDLSTSLNVSPAARVGVGVTHSRLQRREIVRFQGQFLVAENVFVEPLVRFSRGTFQDMSLVVRVRL